LTPARIRPRIAGLAASRIREVANAGMGRSDVIPLWFGEPDIPTPAFICDAATRAMREGRTFYTPNRGIPELRAALSRYMSGLRGRPIGEDRVTVTASGMSALMLISQALIDAGDNMVLTEPLWPNIADTVRVMGGEARAVPLEAGNVGWRLDLDRLRAAIDDRTRAIFLNSPSNPTGWMLDREGQRTLLDLARSRGFWIVADEVYDRIVYDGRAAPSFLDIATPEDPVIVVNSFSKSWAMTGWRLGWITAPAEMGAIFEKLNEFNMSGPTTFVQHAGITALEEGEPFIAEIVGRYRRARDLVTTRLGGYRRVTLAPVAGAFYAFFRVDGMTDSLAMAKTLVAEAGVGLAPGVAFGPTGEGHLRLCFASTEERLALALDRLAPYLDR